MVRSADVGHFFARLGEKMTHDELNIIGK